MPPPVMCAVDLSPTSVRVLFHAAGLAAVLETGLKVLHVTDKIDETTERHVVEECLRMAPYTAMFNEQDVLVRSGPVAETIQHEASRLGAAFLIAGSSSHGSLTKLLMGSTSDALLRETQSPTLLVPPNDFDIVTLSTGAALTCGPVLAAVDVTEDSRHQLEAASRMARLAGQPLMVVTVTDGSLSDHDASEHLRARVHGLLPIKPTALIVRRGVVAEEISRCAVAEQSGLVVMGLRRQSRGRPGVIASAVLATGRAFVLAIPAGPAQ